MNTPGMTNTAAPSASFARPSPPPRVIPPLCAPSRPSVKGKFLFLGPEKFYVRGVTYGPFRPEADGCQYHSPDVVSHDFALMHQQGINSVRIYTLPPLWLLDLAAQHGLRVLIGLPWEQHVTFLSERRRARDIQHRVRDAVRSSAGHPAVLGYAVGNEIPAPIVRWYGHHRVQEYLERLYWTAKEQDPEGLVTYVNYPSTEYLDLPFLDFVAFNVYLETPDKLRAYIARLQNLTGDRPLLMGEVGLDSLRHGESGQARVLAWQAQLAFGAGCAGLFFFSWTDEWFRGGHEIDDWQFGLTTRTREPKLALETVRRVFQNVPFAMPLVRPVRPGGPHATSSPSSSSSNHRKSSSCPHQKLEGERGGNGLLSPALSSRGGEGEDAGQVHGPKTGPPGAEAFLESSEEEQEEDSFWPLISVIVCTYNGGRTLRACLEALSRLDYPSFEVIVVNDGSTDNVPDIAAQFDLRLIGIPNGGLSNARNVGWQAAKGEIVAFLDDDAAPDPHWLQYLAATFAASEYAGIAGPNIAWPDDGVVSQCVDHAPGNPTHVLITDQEAEHLPGCNMAYRKNCLAAVGGFDTQFKIAGDDVDLCWRLQQHGWKLGFHPAALVWHHRRGTLRGYWRQQVNYGKAEAMLERKWPEKYNAVGHATWNGRLYNKGFLYLLNWSQRRIYHGTWGSALFQSVYNVAPSTFASILMLPEWYLVIALLAVISAFSTLLPPLRFAWVLLPAAFLPPLTHAAISGARAFFRIAPRSRMRRLKLAAFTALLHFLQPAARLWGRLCHGLTPWRRRGRGRLVWPWPQMVNLWSEGNWQGAEQRLGALEKALRGAGVVVARGGEYDRWDLEVRGGLLGTARVLMAIEEHGDGRQYVRVRLWPMASPLTFIVASIFAGMALVAALDLNWTVWALLDLPAISLVGRALYECASAMGAIKDAVSPRKLEPAKPKAEPVNAGLKLPAATEATK